MVPKGAHNFRRKQNTSHRQRTGHCCTPPGEQMGTFIHRCFLVQLVGVGARVLQEARSFFWLLQPSLISRSYIIHSAILTPAGAGTAVLRQLRVPETCHKACLQWLASQQCWLNSLWWPASAASRSNRIRLSVLCWNIKSHMLPQSCGP